MEFYPITKFLLQTIVSMKRIYLSDRSLIDCGSLAAHFDYFENCVLGKITRTRERSSGILVGDRAQFYSVF